MTPVTMMDNQSALTIGKFLAVWSEKDTIGLGPTRVGFHVFQLNIDLQLLVAQQNISNNISQILSDPVCTAVGV